MSVSFSVDAGEIAEEIKRMASESISEEDLRQGVEYILKSKARYEVIFVSGARPDSLYGRVII